MICRLSGDDAKLFLLAMIYSKLWTCIQVYFTHCGVFEILLLIGLEWMELNIYLENDANGDIYFLIYRKFFFWMANNGQVLEPGLNISL